MRTEWKVNNGKRPWIVKNPASSVFIRHEQLMRYYGRILELLERRENRNKPRRNVVFFDRALNILVPT